MEHAIRQAASQPTSQPAVYAAGGAAAQLLHLPLCLRERESIA